MILIGTNEGIYRWSEGAGWPVFHGLQDREVVGLVSPGRGMLTALSASGEVLESENNGMDWRVLPLPEGVERPTTIAADLKTAGVVVASRPMGLYGRRVGAATPRAKPAPVGMGSTMVHRARGLADGATALIAPGRKRVAPTLDAIRLAGWSALPSPPVPKTGVAPEVRALAEVGGSWFAAVGGAGLWRTTDLGKAWVQCEGLPAEVYGVRGVPGRAGQVWSATHEGCRLSVDGGITWEDRSAGLEGARHVRAIEVKPGAPDVLLAGAAPQAPFEIKAASRQGLNFGLYESVNGGKSWTQVLRSFPDVLEYDTITDIRFDPADAENALVALGSGELWVTRNGGFYWGPLARQIRAARVLCAVG